MNHQEEPESLAKIITVWATLIGSMFFWGLFLTFIAINLFDPAGWLVNLIKEHPAAMLLLPLAALASFCNVLILKITDGNIKLDVFKAKFEGASGPIIMWALSFGSMVAAIYLLWPCKP